MIRVLLLWGIVSSLPAGAVTWVVSAGVERYDDERIAPLQYAVADAKAVAAAFRASGVAAPQVTLLTSDQTQPTRRPTRSRLIRALEQVRRQAEPSDQLIVFFAGHGVEQDGEQFLLCQDTSRDLLADTALPMQLVSRALAGLQAAEVLFLIDACRNEPNTGRGEADAVLSETFARGLRPRLAEPGTTKGPRLTATLLACEIGQRAWEAPEDGHGVFTLYLLRGLAGEAAGQDGQVRLSSLASYVTQQVGLWSARSKREQTPKLVNPDGGDMTILTPPPEPVVSVAFQNHTLAQAIDLIAEQYGVQVVLGKGVDAEARVSGRLDNQPLSSTLRVLLLAHDLTVRREGKIYIIEPPGATPPAEEGAAPTDPQPANWPDYLPWPPATDPQLRFRVHPKDGMPQVLIPAGEFLMGSSAEEQEWATREAVLAGVDDELRQGIAGEGPRRLVRLNAYWMDLHEVTNEQYSRFLEVRQPDEATRRSWVHLAGERASPLLEPQLTSDAARYRPVGGKADYPVIWVTWTGAGAYAAWAGRALPTEAQWERAARAGRQCRYVWGDSDAPPAKAGNLCDEAALVKWPAWRSPARSFATYQDGYDTTSPVGAFGPNPLGLFDMAGNVWEWCQDWYHPGWYATMPQSEPNNASASTSRVLRGGSWLLQPCLLRVAARAASPPETRGHHVGFRCVSPR